MHDLLKKVFRNSVIKNFSILAISNILVQILGLLSSIKIAKGLMPEDFGVYTLLLTFSAMIVILSSLGLRNVIVRSVAVSHISKQLFFNGVISRTFMFILICIGFLLYNKCLSDIKFQNEILILLFVHVFVTLHWDSMESVAFGFEKMKFSAYINVVLSIVWVCFVLALPMVYITLENVFILTTFIQILKTFAYLYIFFNDNLLVGDFTISLKELFNTVQEGSSFYMLAIFSLFTTQLPIIYLEQFSTTQEIAYFNVSFRIISPIQFLIITLLSSLFPNLSKQYVLNYTKFSTQIKFAFAFVFMFGVFCAGTISMFRKEVVQLIYGPTYIKSADVIAVQCWFTALFGLFCLIGTILSSIRQQKLLSKLSVVYAGISIPILLIGSKYGALGLSISFVVSGLINMTYHLYFLKKQINDIVHLKYYFYGFALFILSFLFSFALSFLSFISKLSFVSVSIIVIIILGFHFKYKILNKIY